MRQRCFGQSYIYCTYRCKRVVLFSCPAPFDQIGLKDEKVGELQKELAEMDAAFEAQREREIH